MKIQLHDNNKHKTFSPLTLTRPVGDLRFGILTNTERWTLLVPEAQISFYTEDYLSDVFNDASGDIVVNAAVIPDRILAEEILSLKIDEELVGDEGWIARKGTGDVIVPSKYQPIVLSKRWHLYQRNGEGIEIDFQLLTMGRTSFQLSSTNTIIGNPNLIFVEEGASVEACVLNTTGGPIYIGGHAEIMEGSVVRGPFAMCEHSGLKMGAKIYGPTTLGPYCKVGGEVNNCIFQAYTNKGHDGFLGNSLIGEWCNLGADTNTSNLKNNYGLVKTYSYEEEALVQTEVQFMGLTMGDHSKCGINTMFNTASTVGVSANVFGAEFQPKFIPSFTWGPQRDPFNFEKALEAAQGMMSRRGKKLSSAEIALLKFISDKK